MKYSPDLLRGSVRASKALTLATLLVLSGCASVSHSGSPSWVYPNTAEEVYKK